MGEKKELNGEKEIVEKFQALRSEREDLASSLYARGSDLQVKSVSDLQNALIADRQWCGCMLQEHTHNHERSRSLAGPRDPALLPGARLLALFSVLPDC